MMKKLRNISIVVLLITTIGLFLCIVFPAPDWSIRLSGVILLVSIFTTAFSTAKVQLRKR